MGCTLDKRSLGISMHFNLDWSVIIKNSEFSLFIIKL